MSAKYLEKIFDPTSIAVIGASNRPKSVGYIVFNNLICSDYGGVVFPVNPKHESVQGIQAFGSVLSLPRTVDLAVLATPAPTVAGLVEECGKAGVKGVIIIAAGFAEMGREGRKAMHSIERIRRRYDMRIMGPNCLGVIRPRNALNASFATSSVKPGKVAFISQSGALGTAILDWAEARGIGFSNFVSLGSMMDVDFGDLIDFFGADPRTRSIMLYIESITDARRFMSAARGFAMNKPIIVVKSGRVAEGMKAAASHTGALAGEDAIYDAAFRRVGIIRVDRVADLFLASETLAMQPLPRGNRLVIITNAGGPGVMATDSLIRRGGGLAELAPETREHLDDVLPRYWSRANPVDILGDADAQRYARALEICLSQAGIDGALIILTPQAMTEPAETARQVVEAAAKLRKPVLASWMGAGQVEEGRRILRAGSVPCYDMPEEAIETFLTMYRYKRGIELLYETPEELPQQPEPPVDRIRDMIRQVYGSGRTTLSEKESKEILAYYGIETTLPRLATDRESAGEIAEKIGFPVVMKVQSADITHKSDAGCVILDIGSRRRAGEAFDEIVENAYAYEPDARVDGVAVQRMVTGKHHELIFGAKRDPVFGATILFGAGGVATEAFGDTSLGFPPLNQTLARRLMEETQVYRLLREGHRATPPADTSLVERALLRFSQLLVDIPEIREADLNPVLVSDRQCVAADARMIIDGEWIGRDAGRHEHLALSPYPREFVKQIVVDGMRLTLRPIRPEDEGRWLDMFRSFSPETRRYRFFHVIGDMPHHERVRYVFSDYAREIAIVPILRENGAEKILGVGRITGVAGNGTAEFAVALRDEWQSRGLGEQVFDHLIDIARRKGWSRIVAQVLPDNTKMINLFRKKKCTFDFRSDEKMYSVSYDVEPIRERPVEAVREPRPVERAVWRGASGQHYRFDVYPLEQGIERAEQGVYIFARRSGEEWEAVYIGQGELKVDVDYKTVDRCVAEKRATHVHVHSNGSEDRRRAACADLLAAHIEAYEPHGCNMRF